MLILSEKVLEVFFVVVWEKVVLCLFLYVFVIIKQVINTPPQQTSLSSPEHRNVSKCFRKLDVKLIFGMCPGIIYIVFCLKNGQRALSDFRGPKKRNPIMTTNTVMARRKGDPQHYVEGQISCRRFAAAYH